MTNPAELRISGEPSGQWIPTEGEYLEALLARYGEDSDRKQKARDEALRVVSKFSVPGEVNASKSQLVLGQVQSGKTSNMIDVIGLSLDCGIPLVVVLTGTTKILDSQTSRDMQRNLRGSDAWFNFIEVGSKGSSLDTPESAKPVITRAMDWRNKDVGYPLCVFLLKNHANIHKFNETMAKLPEQMRALPTLIIDDEADQAGPDAGKPDLPSKTNARISELRSIFSNHNYLLYTATPQANLLTHLGNALSPDCVTNLESGVGYIGVGDLFPETVIGRHFATQLEQSDLDQFDKDRLDQLPESLVEALATFLVRSAYAKNSDYGLKFTTMMIHSSQSIKPMDATERWISELLEDWRDLLEGLETDDWSDPDGQAVWSKYFEPAIEDAWRDVSKAKPNAQKLTSIEIRKHIIWLLHRHRVMKLNSNTANLQDDQWTQSPCWFLIGGEKLGRGFRVENLIVTYMPRSSKSASALDTVQQRGRFFGYRAVYKELLRAWLPENIIQTFKTYREHERDLRDLLRAVEEENAPLKSWTRVLRTNRGVRATRRSVIKLTVSQKIFEAGKIAFKQSHPFVHEGIPGTLNAYKWLVDKCTRAGLFAGGDLGSGGQLQRALAAEITFTDLQDFLERYYEGIEGIDSFGLSDLLLHIDQLDVESESNPSCTVVFHEVGQGAVESGFLHTFPLDRRGPKGGQFDSEEPTRTQISGISRSNAAEQRPIFANGLEYVQFIVHVYLFDLYKSAVVDGVGNRALFASSVPVIEIQVPHLKLDTTVRG